MTMYYDCTNYTLISDKIIQKCGGQNGIQDGAITYFSDIYYWH